MNEMNSMRLYGPRGEVIAHKKADPPALGPSYGAWSGRDMMFNQLPGGSIIGFDLSQLTLADYRAMRYHPQINSSLSVLTFMIHQADWRIDCPDKAIATFIEEHLRDMWTRLIRAMSQAFWAGFSPIALEFENDMINKKVVVSKFKDLVPEECLVHWKQVPGASENPGGTRPKLKIYDGIDQAGMPHIPVDNSLWYPLLMENGDYYGRKLLKAAFAPWFFSILIHLFANRYYERFGEPTPIGRYPEGTQVEMEGQLVTSREAMEMIVTSLRSRSAVLLPSEQQASRVVGGTAGDYEWDIQYLESQMRGADFERYMTRLDEEMSLALFTPLLLLRNADVGSHNLGVQHTQTWLWMLNALLGDMKEYIDRYVIRRLIDINFSPNAPSAFWMPNKMGKENSETIRAIIQNLITAGRATVDLEELGQALGMTVKAIKQVTADPNVDPNAPAPTPAPKDKNNDSAGAPRGVGQPRATGRDITARLASQIDKAWKANQFGEGFRPDLGYRRKMELAFVSEGVSPAAAPVIAGDLLNRLEAFVTIAASLGKDEFESPRDFMALFERRLESELEELGAAA